MPLNRTQPDCAPKAVYISASIRKRSTFQKGRFQQNTAKVRVSRPRGHKLNPPVSPTGARGAAMVRRYVLLLLLLQCRTAAGPTGALPSTKRRKEDVCELHCVCTARGFPEVYNAQTKT